MNRIVSLTDRNSEYNNHDCSTNRVIYTEQKNAVLTSDTTITSSENPYSTQNIVQVKPHTGKTNIGEFDHHGHDIHFNRCENDYPLAHSSPNSFTNGKYYSVYIHSNIFSPTRLNFYDSFLHFMHFCSKIMITNNWILLRIQRNGLLLKSGIIKIEIINPQFYLIP
ncbi:unnamed protein product [Trichobilharzia regenti]|nr:unnamed protein product [Trichobilharzia regenti]